jgi:Ca2+/Na+ antiporter
MIDGFLNFFQRAGHYLARINEQFFFHLDVETNVSWAVIILMYALYKIVEKYFSDQKLTSDELLRLLLVYVFFLLVIAASYTDLRRLLNDPSRESSFMMFVVLMLMLVIIIGRLGVSSSAATKKKWILTLLYVPILAIILTNGRILEERMDSLRSLLPRSNAAFIRLPGETMRLEVGGRVSDVQYQRLRAILNAHPDVVDSGIVGRRDGDGLVKLMGIVELEAEETGSERLERNILNFVEKRIRDEAEEIPRPIEAVEIVAEDVRLPSPGRSRYEPYEIALRNHRGVREAAVEERFDPGKNREILVGRVRLQPGFSADNGRWPGDIRHFVNREIRRVRLSNMLRLRWIRFVTKEGLPRTSDDRIDFETLQKRQRNWSRSFRAMDVPGETSDPYR